MTELKRPKIKIYCEECEDIHEDFDIGEECDTWEFYNKSDADSFLLACAEKLEEARKMREKATLNLKDYFSFENKNSEIARQSWNLYWEFLLNASLIENEVIEMLKSKEVVK